MSSAAMLPMRRVLRAGAVAAAVYVPAAAACGFLLGGTPGALGGGIGALIAAGFFGVTVIVALVTSRMSPTMLGAVVLGSWLVKMMVLIGVLVGLRSADFYDRTTFGLALLVGTIAALILEAWVVTKTRVPYVE